MNKTLLITILSLFVFISCGSSGNGSSDDGPITSVDAFNRKEMLTHWANNIIIPAYQDLNQHNQNLKNQIDNFVQAPTASNLNAAQQALTNAYTTWQKANFFEVGPAKNENLRLFSNTYPANAEQIKNLALQTDFQLNLLTNASKQGYPALDYMLNGFAENDNKIVELYKNDTNANQYKTFLSAIAERLFTKSNSVLSAWENGYKNTFINNDGSSASASVDLIANDYLLYYEKFMRNGKVRFPVGYNTGTSLPENVESYYNATLSKELLGISVKALQDFFNGYSYDGKTDGLGFADYLNALDKQNVSKSINEKFDNIFIANKAINGTYKDAVVNERTAVLNLQDKIQENVIPLKVDMLSAMNIAVAYFDGDGD